MLVLLPIIILVFGAVAILVIQRVRPALGYSWLIATGISLLAWATILSMRWLMPDPFIYENWRSFSNVASSISFGIDQASWPYAFSLMSLVFAVVLTDPARLHQQMPAWNWGGILAVAATGLMSILAGNPLTLVLTWTGIDIIEVVLVLVNMGEKRHHMRAVLAFAARVIGTLVVLAAMAAAGEQGLSLTFDNVNPQIGLYLLIATALRLGVVPLYLPYFQEISFHRGYGTVLRLVVPASCLVMLARLPNLVMPYDWAVLLSAFAALAALYGAAMWLAAKNEILGRPYWLVCLAGMCVACVVRGHSSASLAWGVAMLLSGGLLFLFSVRQQHLLFIPILGYLGISGIPFSPAVSGWTGLVVFPFNLLDVIFMVAHVLLSIGYLRHALSWGEMFAEVEPWVRTIYPTGLMLIIVSQWIIGWGGWLELLPTGTWWAGIVSVIFSIIGFTMIYRFQKMAEEGMVQYSWYTVLAGRVGVMLEALVRMDWVYRFFWFVFSAVGRLLDALMGIMEGDGGVLWSLVLLALLVSLMQAGGPP